MKALVTGASSGIGKEMCYYLGELGYDVILVARDKKNLEDVASKIKTNTRVIDLDLSKRENAFKLYEMTKDENIDLLVNGAGFGLFGKTWETDLDRELSMIDLNVTSLHILTKLFLQDMVKRNSGRILNIASSAGFLAGPILNTYYSTIRILGAKRQVTNTLLTLELLNDINIAYLLFILLVVFTKTNIIKIKYIKDLTTYFKISDYILVYLILIIMSVLITNRYARKIFKKSALETYRNEAI